MSCGCKKVCCRGPEGPIGPTGPKGDTGPSGAEENPVKDKFAFGKIIKSSFDFNIVGTSVVPFDQIVYQGVSSYPNMLLSPDHFKAPSVGDLNFPFSKVYVRVSGTLTILNGSSSNFNVNIKIQKNSLDVNTFRWASPALIYSFPFNTVVDCDPDDTLLILVEASDNTKSLIGDFPGYGLNEVIFEIISVE